jgi:hypothetical protein
MARNFTFLCNLQLGFWWIRRLQRFSGARHEHFSHFDIVFDGMKAFHILSLLSWCSIIGVHSVPSVSFSTLGKVSGESISFQALVFGVGK